MAYQIQHYPKKGGFAGTVITYQTHALAFINLQVGYVYHHRVGVYFF